MRRAIAIATAFLLTITAAACGTQTHTATARHHSAASTTSTTQPATTTSQRPITATRTVSVAKSSCPTGDSRDGAGNCVPTHQKCPAGTAANSIGQCMSLPGITSTATSTTTAASPCPAGEYDPHGPQGGCFTTPHPGQETNPVSCPSGEEPADGGCMTSAEANGDYGSSPQTTTAPAWNTDCPANRYGGNLCYDDQAYPTYACIRLPDGSYLNGDTPDHEYGSEGVSGYCDPNESSPCTAAEPCGNAPLVEPADKPTTTTASDG